jgi:hypothetical protein
MKETWRPIASSGRPQSVKARREAVGLGDGESMAAAATPVGLGARVDEATGPRPGPCTPTTTPAAKPAHGLLRGSV